MKRFVLSITEDDIDLNCSACSFYCNCELADTDEWDFNCLLELSNRLVTAEDCLFVAYDEIRTNPLLSKFYDKLKGD